MLDLAFLSQKLSLSLHRHFLVAYSGGVDSHVLLHALVSLRKIHPEIKIRAVHVHHGISQHANEWALHCKTICESLHVDFILKTISIKKTSKQSLEALARNARYNIFAEVLQENEVLVTAHHLDDQTETLLLQLFRGAGVKGLSAISEYSKFAKGELLRPFLNLSRRLLLSYASHYQLVWIEDETNHHLCFNRNFLRHEILPHLSKRWPNLRTTLSRAAKHCSEADQLLKSYAEMHLNEICHRSKQTISVSGLQRFSELQQRNILRHWLHEMNVGMPSEKKLLQLQKCVLNAAEDKKPLLKWKGVEIRRYRDNIYALKPLAEWKATQSYSWDLNANLVLPHQILKVSDLKAIGLNYESFQNLQVKFRQGGETIQFKGHTRCLKKLFQEWGIPPWERSKIPLLYQEKNLVAVYGYCIAE